MKKHKVYLVLFMGMLMLFSHSSAMCQAYENETIEISRLDLRMRIFARL